MKQNSQSEQRKNRTANQNRGNTEQPIRAEETQNSQSEQRKHRTANQKR